MRYMQNKTVQFKLEDIEMGQGGPESSDIDTKSQEIKDEEE